MSLLNSIGGRSSSLIVSLVGNASALATVDIGKHLVELLNSQLNTVRTLALRPCAFRLATAAILVLIIVTAVIVPVTTVSVFLPPSARLTQIMKSMTAFIVQCFFGWRIQVISGNRRLISISIYLLATVQLREACHISFRVHSLTCTQLVELELQLAG